MRRTVLAAVLGALACSCGVDLFPQALATPAPLCAWPDAAGRVVDFNIAPPSAPLVSATDAECAARAAMAIPDTATTCSVRLARYDNQSVHVPAVWVVHLDGLAIPGLGGALSSGPGPQRSPPTIRRALVIVSTDTPTLLWSIGLSAGGD
jgi:hypothetical protein